MEMKWKKYAVKLVKLYLLKLFFYFCPALTHKLNGKLEQSPIKD